jgi:uncharacterized protein
MKKLTNYLLIFLGMLCVFLGVLGIFLPLVPTTPFLLLAAFLFARSSDRFLYWLLNNRWFGRYIRNYREGRGIPAREKIITITMLWLTIIFTSFYVMENWWVRLILFGIAAGVTTHLLRVKTLRPEQNG